MIFLDIGCTCVIIIKFCKEWRALYRGTFKIFKLCLFGECVSIIILIKRSVRMHHAGLHNYVSHCVP